MAGAPHKQKLEYFAFDVDTFDNVEHNLLEIIDSDPKNGFTFWMQIRCAIMGKSNFLLWDRFAIRDIRKYGYSDDQITKYLNLLFKNNLLDKNLFDRYHILTSRQLQGSYLLSSQGRSKVIFIKEYILIKFEDFQWFNQVVHIINLEGELLERFAKKSGQKVNPETKEPLKNQDKPKENKKVETTKTTPIVNKPIHEPAMDRTNIPPPPKTHTYDDVIEFIGKPYEKHDDPDKVFSGSYSKQEFNDYVRLNKMINQHCRYVRRSIHQLSFTEYIEFMEETTPAATFEEIEQAFREMKGRVIKAGSDIYKELAICLEIVRNKIPEEPEVEKATYVRDKEFEDKVCAFWGFNEINHFKNWALLTQFCTAMFNQGRMIQVKEQFTNYMDLITLWGPKFRTNFNKFIGKQADRFADGEWDLENWGNKLLEEKQSHRQGKKESNKGATAVIDGFSDIKMHGG